MPTGHRRVAVYQHPMALVRELARRGRRDLTVVGPVNGNVDYWAAPAPEDLALLRHRVDPRGMLPRPGSRHWTKVQ